MIHEDHQAHTTPPTRGYERTRRGKHSPYSEPAGLITPCERPHHSAPRPRSSSASLDRDRRGPVVPPYPPLHVAVHSRRRHLAPHVSSREHSPDSRESHSRSSTHSPLAPTRLNPYTGTTVPSLLAAAASTTPTSAATSRP